MLGSLSIYLIPKKRPTTIATTRYHLYLRKSLNPERTLVIAGISSGFSYISMNVGMMKIKRKSITTMRSTASIIG